MFSLHWRACYPTRAPSFVITSFHLDSIALRDFRGCRWLAACERNVLPSCFVTATRFKLSLEIGVATGHNIMQCVTGDSRLLNIDFALLHGYSRTPKSLPRRISTLRRSRFDVGSDRDRPRPPVVRSYVAFCRRKKKLTRRPPPSI